MTFNEDELGKIQAALAAYTSILKDMNGAKEKGYIPPCLNVSLESKQQVSDLLHRVHRRNMS